MRLHPGTLVAFNNLTYRSLLTIFFTLSRFFSLFFYLTKVCGQIFSLAVLSICFLLVVRCSNPEGTGLSPPFLSDPPISLLGPHQPISSNSNQFQANSSNFTKFQAIPNEENYLKFSHLQHPTSISGLMVRLRSVPDNLEWKIKSWAFRVIVQVARKRIVTQAPHKKES